MADESATYSYPHGSSVCYIMLPIWQMSLLHLATQPAAKFSDLAIHTAAYMYNILTTQDNSCL